MTGSTRREVVRSLLAAAAALVVIRWLPITSRVEPPDLGVDVPVREVLQEYFAGSDQKRVAHLGRSLIVQVSRAGVIARAEHAFSGIPRDSTVSTVVAALRASTEREHRGLRHVAVSGWLLAETEAALVGLHYLVGRGRPG